MHFASEFPLSHSLSLIIAQQMVDKLEISSGPESNILTYSPWHTRGMPV